MQAQAPQKESRRTAERPLPIVSSPWDLPTTNAPLPPASAPATPGRTARTSLTLQVANPRCPRLSTTSLPSSPRGLLRRLSLHCPARPHRLPRLIRLPLQGLTRKDPTKAERPERKLGETDNPSPPEEVKAPALAQPIAEEQAARAHYLSVVAPLSG